jgi:hypothetical protein
MNKQHIREIVVAIGADLITLGLAYFSGLVTGRSRLLVWACIVVLWFGLYLATSFGIFVGRRWWLRYFPLTLFFVRFIDLKRRVEYLEDLLCVAQPEIEIISRLYDSRERLAALKQLVEDIGSKKFTDAQLAAILERLGDLVPEVLKAGRDERSCLRQVLNSVSKLPESFYGRTWTYFLRLMELVFDADNEPTIDRFVRRDLVLPLTEAIPIVRNAHRSALVRVVRAIMEADDDEPAKQVLRSVCEAGCTTEVRQAIFEEAKRRAERHPREFGPELLETLKRLEHRLIFLNLWSLHDLFAAPLKNGSRGFMAANQMAYRELSGPGGVFATPESDIAPGVRNGRVYRRLVGSVGTAKVCALNGTADGQAYDGESLALCGVYCRDCDWKPGTEVLVRLTLSSGLRVELSAHVADFHQCPSGEIVHGRGLMFTGGDETNARLLFDYVTHN